MIACSSADTYACDLNSLVWKYFVTFQGRLDEAGPLFERSVAIREKVLGLDHPDVATALNDRASLLQQQVRTVRILQDHFSWWPVDLVCRCPTAGRGDVVESAGESRQKCGEISCARYCGLSMLRICSSSFDGLDHIPFPLQRKCEQAGRSYGRSLAIGETVPSRALSP